MGTFAYKVSDRGVRMSGTVEADGPDEALQVLRARSLIVFDLKPAAAVEDTPVERDPRLSRVLARATTGGRKKEITLNQLAALLDAGVSIDAALEVVAAQSSPHLRRSLERVAVSIREGSTFTDAFERELSWFGDVTIGMLRIGEANGQLPEMLRDGSRWLERGRKIRARLMEALSYPAVVILLAAAIGFFLVTRIIPKILEFLTSNGRGANLPESTQLLVSVTEKVQMWGPTVAGAVVAGGVAVMIARRGAAARRRLDGLLLRVPVLGSTVRSAVNAMWCRTLGLLLRTGIPVLEAIDLVARGTVNGHVRHQLEALREHILEGASLAEAMGRTDLARICPMATAMTGVGEGSGRVDEGLIQAAVYSEEDLVQRIDLMSKLIEPVIYVIVGVMVGFVYYSFFAATQAVTQSLS